ncbi:MAG: type III-A CRISPR-associated protein Cas10/Csm1 [Thermoplasmatales archaeon]|nr:type III-A CRISPR-associated protein Cas10/Csm1 [Thermoplasmatales archaeon]
MGRDQEIWLLRIASILHDIGKFWQGAGEGGVHQDLSQKFINTYLEGITTLPGSHHDYEKYMGREYKFLKILVAADWLAAGERTKEEEERKRKETPMLSIFSKIKIVDEKIEDEKGGNNRYIPPLSYSVENIFYPTEKDKIKDLESYYKNLWNVFCKEVKNLNKKDLNALFISLYYLLQKYTSFIPSAVYKSKPDISLFDHSKMSCAIADCLYKNADIKYLDNLLSGLKKSEEKEELNDEEKKVLENGKFLLIGGDISGIQKFIYTIISKRAAKGLKGRSFYLELLDEIIAFYILDKLDLSIANLIYCAGGHFYILAPTGINIDELRKDISLKLFEVHKGRLYLAIESVELSPLDFRPGNFPKKLKELSDLLGKRKKKRFEEIMEEINLFEPVEAIDICQVCGEPITSSGDKILEEEEEKIVKCKICKGFEELADEIRKKYLIIMKKSKEDKIEGWNIPFIKFGYKLAFSNSIENFENVKIIYKINDTNFVEDIPYPLGYKFYLITPSQELEKLAENAEGLERWGVIRGDVDNLGLIFSKGLGKDATISGISTLSSMLSFFFKGWMNKICEEYKNKIYGIYSGGDDFFIVGSWDVLPKLAEKIYEEFRKFTCENPYITLSVGISIAPSVKYPIYRTADMAGEELERKAKNIKGKDAIAFLGKAIKWDDFKKVKELKDEIFKKLENGVSKGLLHKLYGIYDIYKETANKKGEKLAKYDGRYGRWRWLLAYTLAREKIKDKEEFKRKIRENIDYLDIAVRWCEYLKRERR